VPRSLFGRKWGILCLNRARNMQDLGYDLPRIYLLGRWVSKCKKKGQDIAAPTPKRVGCLAYEKLRTQLKTTRRSIR
jgi:hypothetical protein